MADYYSILKKAVSGLQSNTAENRAGVYVKARAAIERQLRAINPALSEDAVAKQMGLVESAIERLESEQPVQAAPPSPPPSQPRPTLAPVVAAAPKRSESPVQPGEARPAQAVPAPPRPAERPVVRPIERPAPRPAASNPVEADDPFLFDEPAPARPAEPERPAAAPGRTPYAPTPPRQSAAVPVPPPAPSLMRNPQSRQAPPPRQQSAPAPRPTGGEGPGQPTRRLVADGAQVPSQSRLDPRNRPPGEAVPGQRPARPGAPAPRGPQGQVPPPGDGGQPPRPARRPGPAPQQPAYDDSFDSLGEEPRAAPVRRPVARGPRPSDKEGSGFSTEMAMIIGVGVVIFLLLAGGGYALWANRAPLMSMLGMGQDSGSVAVQQEDTGAPAADGADATPKEEARLGSDGQAAETPPPIEDEVGTDSGEDDSVPLDGAQPDDTEQTAADETTSEAGATEDSGAPAVEVSPVGAQDAPATPAGQAATAIAQKAYLYEEGLAGAGASRDNAAILWSLEQESPAEGLPPEAVIKGHLDVPGRGLAMDLTIKRNVDEALPASHIIELLFQVPSDFSGGNIDNVARFVMKSSEQARGEGLVAVPAKIDAGYFLIALNNLEQAMQTNERLLLDSSWIDIPLGYTSGRRALVTLEKGAIGDKVFRDAFADWATR